MAALPLDTPLKDLSFVAFDTETTGLLPAQERIVEVSAVKFRLGTDEVEEFDELVDPGRRRAGGGATLRRDLDHGLPKLSDVVRPPRNLADRRLGLGRNGTPSAGSLLTGSLRSGSLSAGTIGAGRLAAGLRRARARTKSCQHQGSANPTGNQRDDS